MFNTHNKDAVTGTIRKTHHKSWFECFATQSERAHELLTEGGHWGYYINFAGEKEPAPEYAITVLQVSICGNGQLIAECVYTKDLVERE